MELLLSTPVTPIEIILGKLVPYLLLGLGGAGFVYLIARTVFAVPFQGSHLLYLLGCLLFLACGMLQGILISVVTRAQQVAMQAAMISGLLPSVYLSGFIYPIEHMPGFFQALTLVLPPRWFMKISRDLYLKGSGFAELLSCYGALSIISLVLLLLASRKFKKDLEP
jgi:ABC-2 type transport system permease protein